MRGLSTGLTHGPLLPSVKGDPVSGVSVKTVLALLCMLATFPVVAALDLTEHERLCHAALGEEKRMSPFDDALIRKYAEEFLRRTEMRGTPIVLCATDRAGAGVWNDVVESSRGAVFIVGVGREFARAMGHHMRAIMAHEVGHVVQGDLNHCKRRLGNLELCELEVDRIAVGWVGKPAMTASLKAIIRWSDEESARHPISYAGSGELRERLKVLRGEAQ